MFFRIVSRVESHSFVRALHSTQRAAGIRIARKANIGLLAKSHLAFLLRCAAAVPTCAQTFVPN